MKSHRINRPLKNVCKSFTANTIWSFCRISKLTSTFQETFNIRIIIFQSKKKKNTWNHIMCMCIPVNSCDFKLLPHFMFIFFILALHCVCENGKSGRNDVEIEIQSKKRESKNKCDTIHFYCMRRVRIENYCFSRIETIFYLFFYIFHEHSSSHRAYAC